MATTKDHDVFNTNAHSFSAEMLQEFLFNLAKINNERIAIYSKFSVRHLV